MGIPNRQIGWSNTEILYWQIAKQLEKIVRGNCPCPTTTTTTTLCPPNCFYSGIMTVGQNEFGQYGYTNVEGFELGEMTPSLPICDDFTYSSITWNEFDNTMYVTTDALCDSITITINGTSYIVLFDDPCAWQLNGVTENPFPAVGETCIICIECNTSPTTTTTTTTTTEEITTTTTTTTLPPQ